MEALLKKLTGKLETLSVQQLIDCGIHHENNGCKGGEGFKSLIYLEKHPLLPESLYPYRARVSVFVFNVDDIRD